MRYDTDHKGDYRSCVRCGRRRWVKAGRRNNELCADCKSVLQLCGQLHEWVELEEAS
jgi:hypothetical protein